MASKFDELRAGNAVEIRPGLSGQLNKEKKLLQLSNGRNLDVNGDTDFFPENEEHIAQTRARESVEQGTKGNFNEFAHQFKTQGLTGGVRDIYNYATKSGDDYIRNKQAEQQASSRISKTSPFLSAGATAASIAGDVALTGGMSAVKAAPLLTAGSAGSRLFTEPGNVALEAAGAAAGGKILDLGTNWLNKGTARRAEARSLPGRQLATEEANVAGKLAVDEANALENKQFESLTTGIKTANADKLKQYKQDVLDRENSIIAGKNDYAQKQAARENEIATLKSQFLSDKAAESARAAQSEIEYKTAVRAHEEETKRMAQLFKEQGAAYNKSLKELPELQKKAQAEHSAQIVENAKAIEKGIPKQIKINSNELQVNDFIDTAVDKSGLAGTRQAGQVKRLLNSVFPEGEILTGKEIAGRYKALEDAIQRSTPEVQQLLNEFKTHLGKRLPTIVKDSVASNNITFLLQKNIAGDIRKIMNDIATDVGQASRMSESLSTNAKAILKDEINSSNFFQRLQNGDLPLELAQKIAKSENFGLDPKKLASGSYGRATEKLMLDATTKQQFFVTELTKKLEKYLGKHETKVVEAATKASNKIAKDVKNTFGLAEPVAVPSPPVFKGVEPGPQAAQGIPNVIPELNYPPQITPPVIPNKIPSPVEQPLPIAPTPQQFTPQAPPTMAPPANFAEAAGDFLEKPILGGRGAVNNPITKLAGLKYLAGGAAPALEAGYLGAKALTSPTAGGEVARMTFKQGGIQAIESWAQAYPSYNNGILESPQDRRSLTKEIENAYDIPIEQKAVLQSKVNRGKPLEGSL